MSRRRRHIPPPMSDEVRELYRRANENLKQLERDRYKDRPVKDRRNELQRAAAWEIQAGYDVIQMRELAKLELEYANLENPTKQQIGEWEEVDHQLEQLRMFFADNTEAELKRYVRLWNKHCKVKYSCPS